MASRDTAEQPRITRAARIMGWITGLAFLAFVVNVLLGKLHDDYGWTHAANLGKTGEFLLLLLTSALLVATALCREAATESGSGASDPEQQNR
jgi:hypothetical protein